MHPKDGQGEQTTAREKQTWRHRAKRGPPPRIFQVVVVHCVACKSQTYAAIRFTLVPLIFDSKALVATWHHFRDNLRSCGLSGSGVLDEYSLELPRVLALLEGYKCLLVSHIS